MSKIIAFPRRSARFAARRSGRYAVIALALALAVPPALAEDGATVRLSEGLLNGFLEAVGPVTVVDSYKTPLGSIKYEVTVSNPKMTIGKDKVSFGAAVKIKAGGVSYGSEAVGTVDVKYDAATNKISVKIVKAIVKVAIDIAGKKVQVAELDVAKYYAFKFEFAGPTPLQSSIDVPMPDGKTRTVAASFSPVLRLEPGAVVVGTEVRFKGK